MQGILRISFLYKNGSLENTLEELLVINGLYYKHDGFITLLWIVFRISAVIISTLKKKKKEIDRYI